MLAAGTAMAADFSWRTTSVQGPRADGLNTRNGVAIFDLGAPHAEAAITVRQVRPAGAPAGGRLSIDVQMDYRFADGATLQMRSRESIPLTAAGAHAQGEWTGEGEVVGGTGRFEGAKGRFKFRAVTGLDAKADGMLGDSFLEGQGKLDEPKR